MQWNKDRIPAPVPASESASSSFPSPVPATEPTSDSRVIMLRTVRTPKKDTYREGGCYHLPVDKAELAALHGAWYRVTDPVPRQTTRMDLLLQRARDSVPRPGTDIEDRRERRERLAKVAATAKAIACDDAEAKAEARRVRKERLAEAAAEAAKAAVRDVDAERTKRIAALRAARGDR